MSNRSNHIILIVDDEPPFHAQLRANMGRNYIFENARNLKQMFLKLENVPQIALILLDLKLEKESGMDALPKLTQQYGDIPVIVVTNETNIQMVVQAMKNGARDYLDKMKGKIDFELWDQHFQRAINASVDKKEIKHLQKEVNRLRQQETAEFPFIGHSSKVKEIKEILKTLGENPDVLLLITGETGTGKEVAARYLHHYSVRKDKPFVAVNLSAVQQSLLESELFGHVKGAFTGASQSKEGYFRQADGGILMLDEIGDINADIQVKLLRFLEHKLIRPVGSDKDIQLDVQILAATHQDLPYLIREGKFRQDLFMRLRQYEVRLPALRERLEDIPLIIDHYLHQKGTSLDSLSTEALYKLKTYHWAGNIRELVNAIEQMIINQRVLKTNSLDVKCLPVDIQQFTPSDKPLSVSQDWPFPMPSPSPDIPDQALSREEELAYIELRRIEEALLQTNFKKGETAEAVGLKNTDNLRYCIQKHYGSFPRMVAGFPAIKKAFSRIVN